MLVAGVRSCAQGGSGIVLENDVEALFSCYPENV